LKNSPAIVMIFVAFLICLFFLLTNTGFILVIDVNRSWPLIIR
jgi:hypothetical protein